MRRATTLCLPVFLSFFLCAVRAQQPITVSAPQTVSERRIDRTHFEYVMNAAIINAGAAVQGVAAKVVSSSPATVVIEDTLIFGTVPTQTRIPSINTFTIRHDRSVPFDPAALQWTILSQGHLIVKAMATGRAHVVALKMDGSLWSWGSNSAGQLGNGTANAALSPVQVGSNSDWASVGAGSDYTVALKSNGSLWAWGANNFGQLGDGTAINKTSPVRIGTANDWAQIAAGYNHTLSLKYDGSLWAWGLDTSGQLGDGTAVNKSVPIQIGTAKDWAQVAGGGNHTLALKHDGSLWVWGRNDRGQVGDGTTSNKLAPVRIGTANDWAQVAGGGAYTVAL